MSVQKILTAAYQCVATRGSVKTSGYGVQTARSTALDQLSPGERFLESLWIMQTMRATLDAVSMAFVTMAYDRHGSEREVALDALTAELMTPRVNPELLRAVVEREFDAGETYCVSTVTLAKQHGTSQATAWRLAERVRVAMVGIADRAHDALKPAFQQKGYA